MSTTIIINGHRVPPHHHHMRPHCGPFMPGCFGFGFNCFGFGNNFAQGLGFGLGMSAFNAFTGFLNRLW